MISKRKLQAYADAAAALSALRRHNVEIHGQFTIAQLDRITSRVPDAIAYAERTGDWVGASLYAENGWPWDWVTTRKALVVGVPSADSIVACAIS